jgi:hypothetical protein
MKYLFKSAICLFILSLSLSMQSQQVGTVNLTKPQEPAKKEIATPPLPDGCLQIGGGFFDGRINPEGGQKREIGLEITKVDPVSLVIGAEFQVEIKLKNTGNVAFQIPWSTDRNTAKAGSDPDSIDYESGQFEVSVNDGTGNERLLKPLSGRFLGSKYSTGSQITIAPGQWVTAVIKLKLEPEYSFGADLKAGPAKLAATWSQEHRHWHLDHIKCEAWQGTYLYSGYYDQHATPAEVTITKDASLVKTSSSKLP